MADFEYDTFAAFLKPDFETGRLFWNARTPDMFDGDERTAKNRCNIWNGKYRGKEAFTAGSPDGYKRGGFHGRIFLAHRVIWLLAHKKWPDNQIDHINGDRSDNRLVNLRDVTRAINMKNVKRQHNNTSGYVGVCWSDRIGKWTARIRVDNEHKYLGLFSDLASAVAARREAEAKYGFHPNHGRR